MKKYFLPLLGWLALLCGAGAAEPVESPSFRRHVVPLLSRIGCSGRECHGSFSGQGGFQLSLFGYDFDKDHKEITADADGNEGLVRVDLKNPANSLVLLKPTMQMKHKGKERIKKDSWEYNLLLKWITDGAKNDLEKTGDFDRLEISPKEIIFQRTGDTVQLRVLAHWKDGAVEDVTRFTRFRSNDEAVSTVSDTGRVECKEAGDTHLVAFYDNGVQPVPVLLPVSAQHGAQYPKIAARTTVDALVLAKLRKLGVVPSEICTDAEFLRRVSLDLAGTLPTPAEVLRFLADPSPEKRAAKVDELLKTPGYAAWWTTKLCDFTGNNSRTLNNGQQGFSEPFSRQWYEWIFRRVSENQPYDALAAGIVLAKGRTKPDESYTEYAREMSSYFRTEHPADFTTRETMPYYWQRNNVRKPEEKALAFAHSFLGVRIECAECHKHPFDQWTQTDFKQFQVFFEAVQYGGQNRKGETTNFQSMAKSIRDSTGVTGTNAAAKTNLQKLYQDEFLRRARAGEAAPWQEVFIAENKIKTLNPKQIEQMKKKNPNFASRVLTPKILGGDEVLLNAYTDPRQPLMDWLRSKENPYFARSFVNRVWANYFGRGIVEPADDMNLANPPVNRELLDHLAEGFVAHGFDMKWLHREIVNSDAYQRSWKPTASNRLDEKNFSRMTLRRLPAEIALDAIAQAAAANDALPKFAAAIHERAIGPNATPAGKGGEYALTLFGKPLREMNCDCERSTDPTLLQTIYTRNDPEMLARLESAKKGAGGWIAELRASQSPPAKIAGKQDLLREKLESQEAKVKLTEPQKPVTNDPAALKKYEAARKRYEAVTANLKAQLQKLPPVAPAAPPARVALDVDKLATEVFLRTVSRPPTPQELALARADIAAATNPVDGVRDLLWAMLNTREFMVNH